MSRFGQWIRDRIQAPPPADASQPGAGRDRDEAAAGRNASEDAALAERARRLVAAARARAADSYQTVTSSQHPLAHVTRERWEPCATAAAACMALQMMVRRPETLSAFEPLENLVQRALTTHDAAVAALFDQCRHYVARALVQASHSSYTGQNIVGDKVGAWMVTTLLGRPPSVREQLAVRAAGRAMDVPLQAWWD